MNDCIIHNRPATKIRHSLVNAKFVISTCSNRRCINPEHLVGCKTRKEYLKIQRQLPKWKAYDQTPERLVQKKVRQQTPKYRAQRRAFNQTPKGKAHNQIRQLKKYNLTEDQYNLILKQQNNSCAICGQPFQKTPHKDHNHQTGKFRGLLCNQCNRGIGYLKDDPHIVRKAANYLEK